MPPGRFPAPARPQSRLPAPDMALPPAKPPLVRSWAGEEAILRGQRVLDGLSGVGAKGWVNMQRTVSGTVSFEMRMSSAAMIPSSILPPPLAATKRGELSARKCSKVCLPLPNIVRCRTAAYLSLSSSTCSRAPRSLLLSSSAGAYLACSRRPETARTAREFRHRSTVPILL